MSDPNVYHGPGEGGTNVAKVNAVAYGVDNTGATDCGPKLSAFFAMLVSAAFSAQQAAWIPAGAYTINTPVVVPSGLILWCEAGAKITSTVPGSSFFDAAFYAEATNFGTVASTTLAAGGAPKGGRTLNVVSSAGFAVGQSVLLGQAATSGLVAQQFVIVATGVGTITTDDPIEFTFTSGDTVQTFSPPNDIHFYGNGALVTANGGGGPLFEMQTCQRSVVQDFNIIATVLTSYVGSWDTASRDCQWERIRILNGGNVTATLAIESGNRVKAIDCTSFNCNAVGFWFAGGANCEARGCSAWDTTGDGFSMVPTTGADVDGTQKCKLIDCTAINCTIAGVGQTLGTDVEITGLRSEYNVYGLYLQGITGATLANIECGQNSGDGIVFESSGGTPCTGVVGASITGKNNTLAGLYVDTGSHQASLSACDFSSNAIGVDVLGTSDLSFANLTTNLCSTAGVQVSAAATLLIANHRAQDCGLTGGSCISTSAASDITIVGGRYRKTQNNIGNWHGITSGAAGALWTVSGLVIEKVGAVTGTMAAIVDSAGANTRLRDVRTVGSIDFGIFVGGGTGTFRLLGGVSLQSVTTGGGTAITPGSAYFNRGTVVANGVTAVPLAFPDIQAAGIETVKLTSTATSAVGSAYLFSQTPGTGFSIKSEAGDANTYDYEIS